MEIGCPSCKTEIIIPATDGAVALYAKPQLEEIAAGAAKQKELDGALSEMQTLRERLALAESERNRVRAEIAKRDEEMAAQAALANLETEKRARELQEKLAAADTRAAKLLQNAKAQEERFAAAEAKLSEAGKVDGEVAQLRAKLSEAEKLRAELSEAQAKLADAKKARVELAAVQAKSSAGENALAETQAKLAEAEKAGAEVADLRAKLSEAEKLRAELSEVQAKLADAEKAAEQVKLAEVEKARTEAAVTQAKLSDTQKARLDLAAAQGKLSKSEQALAEAQTKLGESESALAEMQAKLAAAAAVRAELAETQAKIADGEKLRGVLEEAKLKLKDASNLRTELDDANAQVKEGERWRKQAEAANAQLSQLREELTALTIERDSVKADKGKAESAMASQNTEMDRLRGELLETSEKLAKSEVALAKEGGAIRSELTTLQKQLIDTNAALTALRGERDAQAQRGEEPSADAKAMDAARLELDDALARMKGFAEQAAALRVTVATANAERDEARSLLAKKESAYREISSRVDAARLSAKGALNASAAAAAEAEKAKSEAQEAITRADALQQRVTDLENELAQRDSELGGARNAMHIAQSERDEAMKSYAHSDKEARELKGKLMQAATNEHTLRLQLEAAEKIAATSSERLKGSETEREKLLSRFGELGKNLDESNEQLVVLRNDRDAVAA